MRYTIVTDSHFRDFVKEEDYGFIGQIIWELEGPQIRPMNRGVDYSADELKRCMRFALGARGIEEDRRSRELAEAKKKRRRK